MVFESIVTDLMNRFLGDFIENLDHKQLNIGIWGGKCTNSFGDIFFPFCLQYRLDFSCFFPPFCLLNRSPSIFPMFKKIIEENRAKKQLVKSRRNKRA